MLRPQQTNLAKRKTIYSFKHVQLCSSTVLVSILDWKISFPLLDSLLFLSFFFYPCLCLSTHLHRFFFFFIYLNIFAVIVMYDYIFALIHVPIIVHSLELKQSRALARSFAMLYNLSKGAALLLLLTRPEWMNVLLFIFTCLFSCCGKIDRKYGYSFTRCGTID